MGSHYSKIKVPQHIRLDASTVCQLKCRSCPTAYGETVKALGRGFLKFDDFKNIIRYNPSISHIELSNWGEIFLNKDLIDIIRYAHEHNVTLSAGNGANLNNVPDEVLRALVKYKFRFLSCSLDGASQETYSIYRLNGNFDQVIVNIKKINRFKATHCSVYPMLKWQFVAFGHNEHEISIARKMALDLNMQFSLKLSWDDLYMDAFSPVKDTELIRRETGLDVANREEYREKYGTEYSLRSCCMELWTSPQVNYDGRLLGCSINYWDNYGNVFKEGFEKCLNGVKINAAKAALMGQENGALEIPCSKCRAFKTMKENNSWLTEKDIKENYPKKRDQAMPGNKVSGRPGADKLVSKIYPLSIPLLPDEKAGWKAYHLFQGPTAALREIECHVSVLNKDRCPHLPHAHKEEELLLLLSGETDLLFPDISSGGNQRWCIRAGQFVYYPAYIAHTLQAVSEIPAEYLMFKWYGSYYKKASMLNWGQFEFVDPPEDPARKKGFNTIRLFDDPTAYLSKLHCHVSKLKPGAGYEPHADPYDVAIIVLEGEVETLHQRVRPHGVIYYAAGEPHGMHNPCDKEAKYIVFEFHG